MVNVRSPILIDVNQCWPVLGIGAINISDSKSLVSQRAANFAFYAFSHRFCDNATQSNERKTTDQVKGNPVKTFLHFSESSIFGNAPHCDCGQLGSIPSSRTFCGHWGVFVTKTFVQGSHGKTPVAYGINRTFRGDYPVGHTLHDIATWAVNISNCLTASGYTW